MVTQSVNNISFWKLCAESWTAYMNFILTEVAFVVTVTYQRRDARVGSGRCGQRACTPPCLISLIDIARRVCLCYRVTERRRRSRGHAERIKSVVGMWYVSNLKLNISYVWQLFHFDVIFGSAFYVLFIGGCFITKCKLSNFKHSNVPNYVSYVVIEACIGSLARSIHPIEHPE